MARPIKNNSDYFIHKAHLRNEIWMKAIRRKFSHVGYAVFNYLSEIIINSDYLEIEWSDLNIELIAADFEVGKCELLEIVDYLVSMDILQLSDGKLTCESHKNSLKFLLSDRERKRKNELFHGKMSYSTEKLVIPRKNEFFQTEIRKKEKEEKEEKEKKEKESNKEKEIKEKEEKQEKEKKTLLGEIFEKNDPLETRKQNFQVSLRPFVAKYGQRTIDDFFEYWSEKNRSGTKMRYELEKVFEIGKRLGTWKRKEKPQFIASQKEDYSVNDLKF